MLIPLVDDGGLGFGVPVSTLTPAGLLAVVIMLIALGRLVPRRTMEDVIKDRDDWREAHRLSEESRAELAASVTELLELARTTNALLVAFQSVIDREQLSRHLGNQDPPTGIPEH